jgi:hypothetical protein
MEGSATVSAPPRKELSTVTPLMAVSDRMMRERDEILGGESMRASFLDEKALWRSSDRLLDRCILMLGARSDGRIARGIRWVSLRAAMVVEEEVERPPPNASFSSRWLGGSHSVGSVGTEP